MAKELDLEVDRFGVFTCDECDKIHIVTLDEQDEIKGQILVHPTGLGHLITVLTHTKSVIDNESGHTATHDPAAMVQ